MLVLSRKPGEEIILGGDVRVKVVEVSGNRVKLALVAPREVAIRRGELAVRGDDFGIADIGSMLAVGG